jgi:hypothetical protein
VHLPGFGVGLGFGGFGVGLGFGEWVGRGVGLGFGAPIAVTLQKAILNPAPTSKTRVTFMNCAPKFRQVETVINFFIIFSLIYVSQPIQQGLRAPSTMQQTVPCCNQNELPFSGEFEQIAKWRLTFGR